LPPTPVFLVPGGVQLLLQVVDQFLRGFNALKIVVGQARRAVGVLDAFAFARFLGGFQCSDRVIVVLLQVRDVIRLGIRLCLTRVGGSRQFLGVGRSSRAGRQQRNAGRRGVGFDFLEFHALGRRLVGIDRLAVGAQVLVKRFGLNGAG
jgi:hypothetical protein